MAFIMVERVRAGEAGPQVPMSGACLRPCCRGGGLSSGVHACVCAQAKVDETYRDQAKWTKMSILSSAGMGKFSTDRTIAEYAKDIWHVEPCVVPAPQPAQGAVPPVN